MLDQPQPISNRDAFPRTDRDLEPYLGIIRKGLASRGKRPGDFDPDPIYGQARYFVVVARQLLTAIHSAGTTKRVTLQDIFAADAESILLADYPEKLALRCVELAGRGRAPAASNTRQGDRFERA
jgi:hypothetical protein